MVVPYRERRLGYTAAIVIIVGVFSTMLGIAIVAPELLEPWIVGGVLIPPATGAAGILAYYSTRPSR